MLDGWTAEEGVTCARPRAHWTGSIPIAARVFGVSEQAMSATCRYELVAGTAAGALSNPSTALTPDVRARALRAAQERA